MMKSMQAVGFVTVTAASTIGLTWEDCGDSSTHGKVTDLQPTTFSPGDDVSIQGTGTLDTTITGGSFEIKMDAAGLVHEDWTGDVCVAKTFSLPLNLGTASWGGMACPVAAGTLTLPLGVKLSSLIPASLASGTIAATATADTGDKLVCVNAQMSPSRRRTTTTREPAPSPAPSPPVPPPPSPSACGGLYATLWGSFASTGDLVKDPWGDYFKAVYGELPQGPWPLCTADFWFFHDSKLKAAGVTKIPASVGTCPGKAAAENTRYDTNNFYSPPGTSWSLHWPPYSAFADNEWVEVMHRKDPFGDEHYGAWFVFAKGSGIWLNTGKSIAFNNHFEAYTHFSTNDNEAMVREAKGAGWDSVQFVAWSDHVGYPCDWDTQMPYMNQEIVATALVGTYACGSKSGKTDRIKAGWNATKTCVCDNSLDYLNCDGQSLQSTVVL